MWHAEKGYPEDAFLDALEPGFSRAKDLLGRDFSPAGQCAGRITAEAAKAYGLRQGIPVSHAIIDAHAAVPGCGVKEPGKMVIILGTSSCHMLMHPRQVLVEGIQGVVRDGILPGYHGYEAGQAATGDIFAWFARTLVPANDREKAGEKMLAGLQEKAVALEPGESGLIALDWWNGNRSVLINPELSGLLMGMTLNTRPEEIFRALLEATGFGTRMIIENFTREGVPVEEVIVCGGMAEKNPLLLQIYADITGRPLARAAAAQTCALGAAIFGAAAAGRARGGYDSVEEAVAAMAPRPSETFHPDRETVAVYERLFTLYKEVHDHFGRGGGRIMERLRELRHATGKIKNK
jgi:L-ribulokinase